MPVGGVGGALLQLSGGGDLQRQLAAGLSPPVTPQPSPAAQGAPGTAPAGPGGGGQPGGAQGQPGAPPQVYGPDPVNAQNMGALLQLAQREENARSFNQAMYGIGASFGTKEQQQSNMANAARMGGGGGGGDILGDISKAQGIEQTARDQWYQGRFMAGSKAFAAATGMPEDQAMEVMLSGKGPDVLQTFATSRTPTQQQKDVEYAGSVYAQSRGYGTDPSKWDPKAAQDVASYKSNLAAQMAAPGLDLDARQYLSEKQNGLTTDDYETWKSKHAAAGKLMGDQATDLNEAQKSAPGLAANIDKTSGLISDLKNNPELDKALSWFSTPGHSILSAETQYKNGLMSEKQYNAIKTIEQLQGATYGEAFTSAGSRRTQQEVSAIVSGLSQLGATGYTGKEYIEKALNPLQERLNIGKANALGAAQQFDQIPKELRGYVNPIYLPGGSLYAGKGADWAKDIELTPEESKSAQDLINRGVSRDQIRQHILDSGKRPPAWL